MPSGWWFGQLAGVLVVVAWLTALSLLALLVRTRWPEQREWSRKVVHIGAGPLVVIAWMFHLSGWIAVPAAATITLLAAVNHRIRVLPAVEDIERHSYGTIAYGASITLLLLLFWPARPDAVAAGVMVMAMGDGLAGLVGPLVTSPSWRVLSQRRSLVGTAVMGAVSLTMLTALAALGRWVPEIVAPVPIALVGMALLATVLEQFAPFGIDNLTVPLTVGCLWRILAPGGI